MPGDKKLRICAPAIVLSALCLALLRSANIKAHACEQTSEPNRAGAAPSENPPPPPADVLPLKPELPCSAVSPTPLNAYRVELTAEQEKRALALYGRSIVITAHDHCFHPGDFRDMEAGGITVRTIKPTVDGIFWLGHKRYRIESEVAGWEQRGKIAIGIIEEEARNSGGKILIVRRVADIERAKRAHKLGVILSFEGARPLGGKLENVRRFYDLGLRELQLYWAVPSPLKNPDGTLSALGLQVIREMDRLGIVIDLSHMSAAAFEQAIAATHNPVVLSHCAVATVSEGKPNSEGTDQLGDDTIRAMAKNGGVICLHFYEGYIHPHHGPHATVEDLVDHMDYIKRLVGIDYVALGTDYFPEEGYRWIEGAENMRGMPNVAREMVRRGYTDQEIQRVMGSNLMRVYRKVWKN